MDKNQEMQWRETARWIKFEEDVEEETERWGKPHVASLSFRSLLELRRTIAQGVFWGCGLPLMPSQKCALHTYFTVGFQYVIKKDDLFFFDPFI